MNVAFLVQKSLEDLREITTGIESPADAQLELDALQALAPFIEAKFPGATPFITLAEAQLQAIITPPAPSPTT